MKLRYIFTSVDHDDNISTHTFGIKVCEDNLGIFLDTSDHPILDKALNQYYVIVSRNPTKGNIRVVLCRNQKRESVAVSDSNNTEYMVITVKYNNDECSIIDQTSKQYTEQDYLEKFNITEDPSDTKKD